MDMDIKKDLSAAILVGRSTRMGRDKAFLMLGRQTFIGHLAQALSVCREVFISTAEWKDFSEYKLKVIEDENSGIGPMEGIRQSLSHAKTDHVFICSVDTPFVRSEMIRYLAGFVSSDYDAYVFRDADRVHPLCGIYSRTVLPVSEKMIREGRYRMMDLLSGVRTKYVPLEDGGFSRETLSNINTPEDYRKILSGLPDNGYEKRSAKQAASFRL